ncbi:phosphoadenylyl-sulfate reductase [Haliangium sp.]|uniref:phosphoadenylyl-sulfate reductase n=1 Tax=Haliangium sp. TaxID=2663208 RepID=UPI003D0F9880
MDRMPDQPHATLTDSDALAAKSAELESASAQDILAFALQHYAPRIAISTAFGVEGCALIHMAVQIDPDVQVFTVDTGYLFEETQALKARFLDRYGIKLRTFHPEQSVVEQDAAHGPRLYERDSDACCAMRKIEPTRRALAGLDAWIAGLRRDQGSNTRAAMNILERYDHDDGSPLVKVHPLANWTRSDTWRYVLEHEVPYNPLLDHGYKSIGCKPCTRAVDADADERAGRWGGTKAECGIHTFLPRHQG